MNLENFNDRQIEAITANESRILVIAGAGSGKTSVLTKRIARIVSEGTPTSTIFAVTFTNKAAEEMKDRIYQQIDSQRRDVNVGTFHSMFGKILRDNYTLTNLDRNYQIIDTDDQKVLIRTIIQELDLLANVSQKEMRSTLTKAINQSVAYIGSQKDIGRRFKDSIWTSYDENKYVVNCQEVYERYEEKMLELNLIDFGDMLLYPYEIFKKNKEILGLYQKRYKEILVDEFQDTNLIQYELVKMLAEKSNLFIVGDDDQSIYGWRGAKIENILGFEDEMNARVIKLEQNYRSFGNILDAANGVISNNEKRMGKNLWTDKNSGEKLFYSSFSNGNEESEFIADEIKNLINNGVDPQEIAILYRNNALSRDVEKSLNTRGIRYKIIGGVSFWKRAEIKDIISMLSLIENGRNQFAFHRVISRMTTGIGEKSIERIINYGILNDRNPVESMSDFIENINDKSSKNKLSKTQTEKLEFVKNTLDAARDKYKDISDLGEVIRIFEMTNFVSHYETQDTEEAQMERYDNINSLIDFANEIKNLGNEEEIETLSDFINYAMLQSSADEKSSEGAVQLMTIHASKGLEFECVFLNGLNANIIPSPLALMEGMIDEERRLFYVAITRAKKKLYLTNFEYMFGETTKASPFIKEIPKEYIKRSSEKNRSDVYYKQRGNRDSHLKNLYKGAPVRHPKYGYGEVERYSVEGDYVVIYANFEAFGRKGFTVNRRDLV